MITDEQLTAELTRALHSGTDHLAYTGRVPRARRPIAVTVVPLAATAAVVGVLGWTALTAGGPPVGAPSDPTTRALPSPSASTDGSGTGAQRVVTEEIELAGHTFTYTRGVDEPAFEGGECPAGYEPTGDPATRPCYIALATIRDEVPPGATEYDVDGTTIWVAKDPEIGWSGFYLRHGDDVFGFLSRNRTLDQMQEFAASMRLS